MYVVIINGKGGAGKDTIINYINYITESTIYNYSSIDIVTNAARVLGWTGKKNNKDRKFLSDLKKLSINYNNQPTEKLFSVISYWNHFYNYSTVNFDPIIFCHVREPEEIEKLKKEVKKLNITVYTWLVMKKGKTRTYGNKSDDNVYSYEYDEIIVNDFEKYNTTRTNIKNLLYKIGITYEDRDC